MVAGDDVIARAEQLPKVVGSDFGMLQFPAAFDPGFEGTVNEFYSNTPGQVKLGHYPAGYPWC
jgi:hypothetical protein